MEKEINIAEILKDKPQGTKLYDLLYNVDVELDTINTTDTETVVWCTNETDNNTICHRGYSEFGTVRGCTDGLQILLPSKEMRDWHKFAWKKGDVLVSSDKGVHIIFEKFENDTYTRFKGKHYLCKEGNEEDYAKEETCMLTSVFEKVNDDVAAWTDICTAREQAMESEWAEIGDKHYCPDCYEFDEELDEYVPKMIYRNDVLGNPLAKGTKVLCRDFAFDIWHIWRVGYFKGETTNKRFPYTVMVNGDSIEYSDCLVYTDSTKMLEGLCTRYISDQWQLDLAIKDIKELNKL